MLANKSRIQKEIEETSEEKAFYSFNAHDPHLGIRRMLPHKALTAKVEVYATAMCTMLVVLFYLHQQKKNYRMMGAFTKKSLVKVESKRKRKRKENLGFNGLKDMKK